MRAEPQGPFDSGHPGCLRGNQAPKVAPQRGAARVGWTLLCLFLLSAGLRLASIQHGGPDNYLPDTHVVRNALGMAKDKHPVPPSGQYSSYPYLLSYTLLPVYAGQYAWGRARGEWRNADDFKSAVMSDPWRVHLPARVVLALLAALAPLFVYLGLRRCGLGVGAVWGAVFLATCLLHVHHSEQERPWAPLISAMMACGWASAAYVQSARPRWLLVAGLTAGLAVATHQGGLAAALMPAIAWVLVNARAPQRKTWARAIGLGFACAASFMVVALVLGYPFLLLHGAPAGDAVVMNDQLQGTQHFTLGGQSTVFGFRWATLERLSKILVGYDPGLVLVGVVGLWAALRSRASRPTVLFALIWGAYFLTNVNDRARYLLPFAGGLCWAAGFAAERLWKHRLGQGALLAALTLAMVQVARLHYVLQQTDTRGLLEARLQPDRERLSLAMDIGGPNLPLDVTSLQRIGTLRDLYAREQHRLYQLLAQEAKQPGFRVLPFEALLALDRRHYGSWLWPKAQEKYGNDLPAILDQEGITHVVLADTTPHDTRTPIWLDPLPPLPREGPNLSAQAGPIPKLAPLPLQDPLLEIHPGRHGTLPEHARLPWVMEFPLRDLWQVERPGPVLRLYAWPPPEHRAR